MNIPRTRLFLSTLLAGMICTLANNASGSIMLFFDNFQAGPAFTQNTSANNPNTWYANNPARFSWNADDKVVRRDEVSPFNTYTGIAYGFAPSTAISNDLKLTFAYSTDFTNIAVVYALYGTNAVFNENSGQRIRTDSIIPGSNWSTLSSNNDNTLSTGTGTLELEWVFSGTSYAFIGIHFAVEGISVGTGDRFDLTSVSVSMIPEPGTALLMSAIGLIALGRPRRR